MRPNTLAQRRHEKSRENNPLYMSPNNQSIKPRRNNIR